MRTLTQYKDFFSLLNEDMSLSAYRKNVVSFNKAGNLENKVQPDELEIIKSKFGSVESFISKFNELIKSADGNDRVKQYIGHADKYISINKKYKVLSLYNDVNGALTVDRIVRNFRRNESERLKKTRSQYVHENIDGIDIFIPFTYDANRFLAHTVLAKGAENVPTWCIAAEDQGAQAWRNYGLDSAQYPSVFIFARPKQNGRGWEEQKYEVVFPNNTIKQVINGTAATNIDTAEWRHPQQTEGEFYWSYTNRFRKVFPEWSLSRINSIIVNLAYKYSKQYHKVVDPIEQLMLDNYDGLNFTKLTEILKKYNILLPVNLDEEVDNGSFEEILNYIEAGGPINSSVLRETLVQNSLAAMDSELKVFVTIIRTLFPNTYLKAVEVIKDDAVFNRLVKLTPDLANTIMTLPVSEMWIKLPTLERLLRNGLATPAEVSNFIYSIALGINKNFLKNITIVEFICGLLPPAIEENDNIAKILKDGLLDKIINDIFANKNNVQADIKEAFKKDKNLYGLIFGQLLNHYQFLDKRVKTGILKVLYNNIIDIDTWYAYQMILYYMNKCIKDFKKVPKDVHSFIAKLSSIYWNHFSEGRKNTILDKMERVPETKTIIDTSIKVNKNTKNEAYINILNQIKNGKVTNKELINFISDKKNSEVIPQILNQLSTYQPIDSGYSINPSDIFYYGVPNFNEDGKTKYYTVIKPFVKQYFDELFQFLFYWPDTKNIYVPYIILVLLKEISNADKFLTKIFRNYEHLSPDTKQSLTDVVLFNRRLVPYFEKYVDN